MRTVPRTIRLSLAVALAAALIGLQAWGWSDATLALTARVRLLWEAGWPVLRTIGVPLAAAALLYALTGAASRRWWRNAPWRAPSEGARQGWLVLLLASIGLLLFMLVLSAPSRLVERDTTGGSLTTEQRAKATSDARTALLQATGGLLLAAGALATWRQVRISREGQVTERFTRAVDQLGSEHLDVRLGGLYALERIARDSPGDRRTISEILTAYIRQRAPWPPTQPGQYRVDSPLDQQPDLRSRTPDVQAALTVLGRGAFPKPTDRLQASIGYGLDLSGVDLRKADLSNLILAGANFHRTNLAEASLSGARLVEASFERADLNEAVLFGANLARAWIGNANLTGALLAKANLEGARFDGANLEKAKFCMPGPPDLNAANLAKASLGGANLAGASLDQVNLEGAWLGGANLVGAWGLETAKLKRAEATPHTMWPEGFEWKKSGVILLYADLFKPNSENESDAAAASGEATEPEDSEPPSATTPRLVPESNNSDGDVASGRDTGLDPSA